MLVWTSVTRRADFLVYHVEKECGVNWGSSYRAVRSDLDALGFRACHSCAVAEQMDEVALSATRCETCGGRGKVPDVSSGRGYPSPRAAYRRYEPCPDCVVLTEAAQAQ